MKKLIIAIFGILCAGISVTAQPARQLIDTHIHYSQDAWEVMPTEEAIKVLRQAGLKKAFVSSSSDDGTQKLYKAAPDLIVPVLRPYRRRGEISSWFRDEAIIKHVESRLHAHSYAGIGEFHIFGEHADLPVFRRMVELAKQYKIFLHAHSDTDAVNRIFAQDPDARVLWAHSGFDQPDTIRDMLNKHPRLWCDLAFRSEHASDGKVEPAWKQLFIDFPDRFMVGTDTYTPERWHYIIEHAEWTRQWLRDLPAELAEKIAFRNAEQLAQWKPKP
ncbi:MAG: amidohydrolase [Candidatus Entotheonella gemina]|uniref:Amidohydrolase n=1 Tax=Candidatus Entotheonella gemina TaxID=1429439 RepID=W4M9E1_9BACT|nr:MAG: amidohydrolase [Candidatus Entotheonella gemina]